MCCSSNTSEWKATRTSCRCGLARRSITASDTFRPASTDSCSCATQGSGHLTYKPRRIHIAIELAITLPNQHLARRYDVGDRASFERAIAWVEEVGANARSISRNLDCSVDGKKVDGDTLQGAGLGSHGSWPPVRTLDMLLWGCTPAPTSPRGGTVP